MKITLHEEADGTFLRNETGALVASMESGDQSSRLRHGAEIVRRYNAHDDLLAALGNIIIWDDGNLPGDVLDEARAALAKAKGE